MVEVPFGDHTITCTRLALLDGSHIFLRTKWFDTSFNVTVMDFPRSWSCYVTTQEVEDRASMLGINCEDFFSQARLYLGDGISDSQYSFEALRQQPNVVRLSWTIVDMRYIKYPRVTLFLQEDNNTMELVPEFLNVLMDTTLIVKDLLARRKIKKSKKVRQLAMRSSASKVRKRSLSQEAPTEVGMSGGLDGLVTKSEFPNSTTKFNSSPVSHPSGLTTPMHPPSFKTRVPPPKHSPEFTARLYEHGLSSWTQPRARIQTTTVDIDSTSRLAPTSHDVEVPQNVHNTLTGDKAVLSYESRELGMENSGGWINPRKSSTGGESQNFDLFGSERRGASQGREGVIMLSDSEEEDYHNREVDSGILDDEDLLDPRIPRAMEGLPDDPESRFTIRAGHLNDSMPDPWRENIEVHNTSVSMMKDERFRSRLESEAQTSLDRRSNRRSKSQKRKDRDDANEDRTDIFDEGKLVQSKDQVFSSGGSPSRDKIELDAQNFVPTGATPCIKVEREYQSEANAVLQSGDHPSTSNHPSSAQWKTWISELKSEGTSWEAQVQIGNSMTGGSDHEGNQPAKNVVITSSPWDSDHLVTSLSSMKLDKNLDAVDTRRTDSEHLQLARETLNVNLFPREENSCRELPEISGRAGSENPERSHPRELGKSKEGVSSDVSELEKVKVEREFTEGKNDGDRVEEPGFEPGLHNNIKGVSLSVVDMLKLKKEEKPTSVRSLHGQKVPGRKGRPPGAKAQLHLNPTKSVTQGASTYTDRATKPDKDPRNTNLQRVSSTSRPVGRSRLSNSQGHPSANVNQEQQKVVPDSDCYNFDDDRVKEKIKPNEVWALYHDIDTMPRYLIRVKEVSMTGAFWVKGSWLQSHIASKKDKQQKEKLHPRSCGDFEELKETITFKVINCFSHRMEFTTKLEKVIQVYPRKDEVWALYSQKDLTLDRSGKAKQGKQNMQNVNNFSNNFRLLVILSNCEEGRPLDIWVLRKRIGYRTLWEPGYEKGPLPFKSLERFSHRVPAHKLTVKDYPDLNKMDIWDIDAAAVPECQGKVTW